MRAVAIDFETANETRASPCSIGLAWINDGRIEEIEHHYIRPPGMRFSSWNIAFHGIGPDQVEDADEFPAVMAKLTPRLQGRTVLAHNAAFDMSVVRGTCDLYGLAYPEFDYLCTVKLNDVCAHLGSTSATTMRPRTPSPAPRSRLQPFRSQAPTAWTAWRTGPPSSPAG